MSWILFGQILFLIIITGALVSWILDEYVDRVNGVKKD